MWKFCCSLSVKLASHPNYMLFPDMVTLLIPSVISQIRISVKKIEVGNTEAQRHPLFWSPWAVISSKGNDRVTIHRWRPGILVPLDIRELWVGKFRIHLQALRTMCTEYPLPWVPHENHLLFFSTPHIYFNVYSCWRVKRDSKLEANRWVLDTAPALLNSHNTLSPGHGYLCCTDKESERLIILPQIAQL
jgi:hypothetical protein